MALEGTRGFVKQQDWKPGLRGLSGCVTSTSKYLRCPYWERETVMASPGVSGLGTVLDLQEAVHRFLHYHCYS